MEETKIRLKEPMRFRQDADDDGRQETGSRYRRMREQLDLSRNRMAKKVGVCAKTLKKFEEGRPVSRPNLVETSYRNAIKCCVHEMTEKLESLGQYMA